MARHAIGVDLAWGEKNPTGLAHLEEGEKGWRLSETGRVQPLEGIARWIARRAPEGDAVWVAVDAPLVGHNPPGTRRAADAALSAAFRGFRAGALPTDQRHAVRGAALVERLTSDGFQLAVPDADEEGPRRGVFETFPTAATVALFDLPRPLGYKHGGPTARIHGMRRLQMHIASLDQPALRFEDSEAMREILQADPAELSGAAWKGLEDRMDALVAGLVAVLAFTAPVRLVTYGDRDQGFMTVPHPPPRDAPGPP